MPSRTAITSPSKPAPRTSADVVGAAERRAARSRSRAPRLAQDEADLARAQRRRDRARDRAAPPDRPAEHDGFPPVRELPRDDVAGPHAELPQPRRARDPTRSRRSSTVSRIVAVDDRERARRRRARAGRAASRRSTHRSRASAPAPRRGAGVRGRLLRAVDRVPAAGPSASSSRTAAPSSAGSQRAPLSTCGPCCQPSATEILPPSTSNTRPVTSARLGAAEPHDERRHVAGVVGVEAAVGRGHDVGEDLLGHPGAGRRRDGVGGHAVAASSAASTSVSAAMPALAAE